MTGFVELGTDDLEEGTTLEEVSLEEVFSLIEDHYLKTPWRPSGLFSSHVSCQTMMNDFRSFRID